VQKLAAFFVLVYCLVCSSTPKMEAYVPPKPRLTLFGLQGVIFGKIDNFNDLSTSLFIIIVKWKDICIWRIGEYERASSCYEFEDLIPAF
jgi:hypothetical protein